MAVAARASGRVISKAPRWVVTATGTAIVGFIGRSYVAEFVVTNQTIIRDLIRGMPGEPTLVKILEFFM